MLKMSWLAVYMELFWIILEKKIYKMTLLNPLMFLNYFRKCITVLLLLDNT